MNLEESSLVVSLIQLEIPFAIDAPCEGIYLDGTVTDECGNFVIPSVPAGMPVYIRTGGYSESEGAPFIDKFWDGNVRGFNLWNKFFIGRNDDQCPIDQYGKARNKRGGKFYLTHTY